MNATITLREYLNKKKIFYIPQYQRGYIWGKYRFGKENTNSVEHLIDSLLGKYQYKAEVFLQGFTVTETDDKIILIDGQQRTTCIYLLLKWLGYNGFFAIDYSIRQESKEFLSGLECLDSDIEKYEENENEEFQDIYFFKKTLRIINEKLKDLDDREDFIEFLLDKIHFLYIEIPEAQATRVFSMMNGSKADMLSEEVIKAEILRLASLNQDGQSVMTQEWDNNMLRSRYAREWDKWLYWWNREDVQKLFGCTNTMGLLVSLYLKKKKGKQLSFETFKRICLEGGRPKDAKNVFDGLRRLQKRFEDAFNTPIIYNKIGAILKVMEKDNPQKFLQYYFTEDVRIDIDRYYRLAFLGLTHDEIVEKDKQKFDEIFENKYKKNMDEIIDDLVFLNYKESAFRLLLRLNIDEDNKQNNGEGRKFDFSIWDNGVRSIEHIMPKSKVGHLEGEENEYVDGDGKIRSREEFVCMRSDIKKTDGTWRTTEHSIGNLVLLYKGDNSTFSDKLFEKKKGFFFNTDKKEYFRSRHLLHTIFIFANSNWVAESIAVNKEKTIKDFEKYYADFNNKTI